MKDQEMKMKAKMEMLKKLKSMMKASDFADHGDMLKGKLKKVTVVAPDEEGVEEGLSMAQKILAKKKAMEKSDSSDMEGEMSEDEEGSEMEHDEKDPECMCKKCEKEMEDEESEVE